MALVLFVVVVPVFTFFATPLEAWWSRRHEREADDFAVAHSNAERLAAALVKLYRDNASTLTPDPRALGVLRFAPAGARAHFAAAAPALERAAQPV